MPAHSINLCEKSWCSASSSVLPRHILRGQACWRFVFCHWCKVLFSHAGNNLFTWYHRWPTAGFFCLFFPGERLRLRNKKNTKTLGLVWGVPLVISDYFLFLSRIISGWVCRIVRNIIWQFTYNFPIIFKYNLILTWCISGWIMNVFTVPVLFPDMRTKTGILFWKIRGLNCFNCYCIHFFFLFFFLVLHLLVFTWHSKVHVFAWSENERGSLIGFLPALTSRLS